MAEISVVFNAQLLHGGGSYRNAGISRYIRNLLSWLPRVDPQLSITAFVSPASDLDGSNGLHPRVRPVVASMPTNHPLIRILWEQLVLPVRLRQLQPDILHSPLNVLPLIGDVPSVVTVHDLAFEVFPGTYPALKGLYLRASTRWGTRRANRIVAVSYATASDLRTSYGIGEEKIVVVPNGVEPHFRPVPAEQQTAYKLARQLDRYFLYLGTLQPRKNLTTLLYAWAHCNARRHGYTLVLAGAPGWNYRQIRETTEQLHIAESVRFLGWVPDAEVPTLLSAATAFLYPSLYEGFGLPVIEAMACGTPAAVSDAPALKEVAANACLVVEAKNVAAWAQTIDQLAEDSQLRRTLSQRGLELATTYSWENTARLTSQVYRQVAGS